MENASIGARYFLTFIDDFSRKVFVYFLRSKSEVLKRFKEFKKLVEVQTERKVKAIRIDNGAEYCSKDFEEFCSNEGVLQQTHILLSKMGCRAYESYASRES